MRFMLVAGILWAIIMTTVMGWYKLMTHLQSVETVLGLSSIIAVGILTLCGAIKRRGY